MTSGEGRSSRRANVDTDDLPGEFTNMESKSFPRHSFDLRGLRCPLPVLKTAKRMEPLAVGAHVEVLADDPLAKLDIPHFCAEKGHRLVEREEADGVLRFVIEKGG